MGNEQTFKDPLSSTYLVSSERRVLDLESEIPGSIVTGTNILSLDFSFPCSKDDRMVCIFSRKTEDQIYCTSQNIFQENIQFMMYDCM